MKLPLNIDIQQILLHMFNFAILFAALYFLLYKPVKSYIDAREDEYKKAADEAKSKRQEAEEAAAALEKELSGKAETAKRERAELAAAAQKQYEKRISEAEAEANRIIDEARKDAERIRKKAVDQSSDDISELAIESVGKAVMSSAEEAFEAFLSAAQKDGNNE